MNSQDICRIIESKITSKNIENSEAIFNLTTDLQRSEGDDLCFYRLHDRNGAVGLFKERLKKSKASLIIINRKIEKIPGHNIVSVENDIFEDVIEEMSEIFYPYDGKIKLAGVTGTNGKTSIVYLGQQMAREWGYRSFSLGTLGLLDTDGKCIKDFESTTLSYTHLRKILFQLTGKADVLFMEVSSHGLDQNRLGRIVLDVGAWSNFGSDHLDYHKTIEQYFMAKLNIFNKVKNRLVYVANADEKLQGMISNAGEKFISPAKIEQNLPIGLSVNFNRSNLELAYAMNCFLWGETKKISFEKLNLPSGRFQTFERGKKIVIVDYAHTPDALNNLLSAIRNLGHKNLLTVFGCGGDRDRSKRPLMGKVVDELSELAILTSDNPRSENPLEIMDEIKSGMKKKVIVLEDRKEAIRLAIRDYSDKYIIVVAGKGHESYQDVKGVKHHLSDIEEVERNLRELND